MISAPVSRFPFALQIVALVLPLLIFCSVARAQDAVRPSLAGEATAEARRQSIDHIPYNLLAGPVRFRFSATFGIEYNDNINLADVQPRGRCHHSSADKHECDLADHAAQHAAT